MIAEKGNSDYYDVEEIIYSGEDVIRKIKTGAPVKLTESGHKHLGESASLRTYKVIFVSRREGSYLYRIEDDLGNKFEVFHPDIEVDE